MPGRRLRSLLVRARDALDGRLHRTRKDRAQARLSRLQPRCVLFLCLGNVCRSPYGARVLEARLPDLRVASAGFIGPDRAPPDMAQRVARSRGLRHADHRSRVVTPELLAESEAIFVFDRLNITELRKLGSFAAERLFWLGDFDSLWSGKRAIIDPWGGSAEEFDRTFERIERCIDEVVRVLERL